MAGPSGSGKTFTSLAIATALGGRIALVDTEHGSASKYADLFDFDVLNLDAPFHPDRFVEAIRAAQAAGYQVLILDSLSHAWSGPGGVLEIKEQLAKRREYNDYTAWGPAGELQNRLVQAILRSDLHVIATMRSKTSYAMDEVIEDGRKRTKVVKQGMAPIQRDGFEYEFDVFIDMDIDNNAIVTKTRCPALTGKVFPRPGADVAEILATWLKGQPAPEPPPTDPSGQGHDPAGGGNGAGGGGGNGTGAGGGNGTAPVDPQAQAGAPAAGQAGGHGHRHERLHHRHRRAGRRRSAVGQAGGGPDQAEGLGWAAQAGAGLANAEPVELVETGSEELALDFGTGFRIHHHPKEAIR
ncbi:MAG: ATP-binding protein [Anaerolineae bacterium]